MEDDIEPIPLGNVSDLDGLESQVSVALIFATMADRFLRRGGERQDYLPVSVFSEILDVPDIVFDSVLLEPETLALQEFSEGLPMSQDGVENAVLEYCHSLTRGEDIDITSSMRALLAGSRSINPFVRINAISSISRLFNRRSAALSSRLEWFRNRYEVLDNTTKAILSELRAFTRMSGPTDDGIDFSSETAAIGLPRALMVHGTHLFFLPDPNWHIPGIGQFFNFVKPIRPDLYGGNDFFEWEGNLTDRGRRVAAKNLLAWVKGKGISNPDIIAHSHGCSVVMLAANMGLKVNKAIFLSCPVQWSKYNNNAGMIDSIQSIRTKFDFVIAAARSAQRFPAHSGIAEHIISKPFFPIRHLAIQSVGRWKVWRNTFSGLA